MSAAHDLGGRWSGLFSYPRLLPPTHFDAVLRDHQGAIAGETSEPDLANPGQTLHAVVEGDHSSGEVLFIKIYDDLMRAADVVHYRGTIQPGGNEIGGIWDIAGVWSGSFLMIRGSGVEEAVERLAIEAVR